MLAVCTFGVASAQPDVKKAAKSLFTVKSFDANGGLVGSGNGFFVGENGEAVSNFSPFNGAARAIVIDASGKEYAVDQIIGGSEMYDVAKFHVNIKRSIPLAKGAAAATEASVWLLPFSKSPKAIEGKVTRVEKVGSDYDYYSMTLAAPDNVVGCPVFNAAGEVIGMLQSGTGEQQYAVSVLMAADMRASGLSINDPAMKLTSIKKALPDDVQEALVSLYVGSSTLDSLSVSVMVDDFIAKFPTSVDGYVYRANRAMAAADFAAADSDMQTALKMADNKCEAHFNYAKMMFDKTVYAADKPFDAWTLDKACSEAEQAIGCSPLPLYKQLKAQIVFAQKKYDESEAIYKSLIDEGEKTAENYYGLSRGKEMLNDSAACLAMLDSAVATFSRPYLKDAAPYILARAQMLMSMEKYRLAVNDFNDYEQLMVTLVNDNFYYLRSQAEANGRLYKQALDDLKKALQISPANTLYLAEKSSLELRVGLKDEAIATAKECIEANPNLSDGYLFLGLAQCNNGQKAEGLKNLQKAKELGDPQAQDLIDRYSK